MSAEQLEIAVSDQKKNQLLGRTELKVQVKHMGRPTPTRQSLRAEVGRISKEPPERVFIRKIVTDYGAGISECVANVYATSEAGEAVESEYIRTRNTGVSAKKPEAPAPKEPEPAVEKVPATAPEKAPVSEEGSSGEQKPEAQVAPPKPEEVGAEEASKPKLPRKKPTKEKSDQVAAPETEKKES